MLEENNVATCNDCLLHKVLKESFRQKQIKRTHNKKCGEGGGGRNVNVTLFSNLAFILK